MEYSTISIPKPLNERIKKLVKNTGFPSVSSFVAFIMRELLSDQEKNSISISEEKIKQKLKDLGYL